MCVQSCSGPEKCIYTLLKGLVKYLGAGCSLERDQELEGTSWQDVNGNTGLYCEEARETWHQVKPGIYVLQDLASPTPRVVSIVLHAAGVRAALTSKLFFPFGQVLQGSSPPPRIRPSPLEVLFMSPSMRNPNRLPEAADTGMKVEGSTKEHISREGGFMLPLRPFFLEV